MRLAGAVGPSAAATSPDVTAAAATSPAITAAEAQKGLNKAAASILSPTITASNLEVFVLI